jgi:chemotaxis protein MotB
MADKKDDKKRPIIIKKVIKKGGGHHGGAWKVAYADFVTAMMAFFLLLWLLSTSSKATLEGISEYFTPTTGVKDSQGIGFKGGTSATVNGTSKSNMSQPGVITGTTPSGAVAENEEKKAPEESDQDDNLFKEGATAVTQAFSQDKALQAYQENIQVQETPEGLRIDITDSDKYPMFDQGTPNLTSHGQIILGKMASILKRMPNYLSITGHTDGSPVESGKADYTNWELSSDRAQAARRFLLKSGMEPERPKRIVGMADKEMLVPSEPRSPKNRRITLVMLRGSHILIPDSAVPAPASAQ